MFKIKNINDVEIVYSILREQYPKKKINIVFNYNTKEYVLNVTNEPFIEDPEIPVDLNIEVVYGDSVVGDTPVILRDKNTKNIIIKRIDDVCYKWEDYEEFKMFDTSIRLEKQYSLCDYQIWCDKGWSDIKKIIRHKTNKSIYRVNTYTGIVEVTEDHSLCDTNLEKIKPMDVKVGASLLHSFPNYFHCNQYTLSKSKAYTYGQFFGTDMNIESKVIPDIILNAEFDVIFAFIEGVMTTNKYYHNFIRNEKKKLVVMGKIATQGLYYLLKKIGYNVLVSLLEDNDLYHLEFSNIIYGCEDKVKCINKIKDGDILEYVYDIETENGRFNAGIGKMTIFNTDSVFLKFKYNRDDFEKNRVDTFKLATLCGNNLTDVVFDRPPIVLEFEKVFNPFILLTKKRYIAKKYENMKDPFYLKGIDAKGIALTRRDYCLMVKKCYKEIIDTIMDNSNKDVDVIERSLGVFRGYLDRIDKYDIVIEDLVISAQIGKDYSCKHCKQKTSWILRCENKNGSKLCNALNPQGLDVCKKCKNKIKCVHSFSLAHINLAQRMLNRNDEVTVGDRLAYIYVENSDPKAAKNEMADDPKYAVKNGLKMNRLCYLEQVAKPILGLYRVCLQHRQKELDDIIEFVNDRMVKYGGKKLKPSDYKIEDE